MALQKKTSYEHTLGGRAEGAAEKVRLTFRKVGGGGLLIGGAAAATALLLAGTLVFSPATIERASNGIQDRFRQIIQSDGAKEKAVKPVATDSEQPIEVPADDATPVEADAVQDFVLSSGTAPLDKGVPGGATPGGFGGSVELDEDGATADEEPDETDEPGTDEDDPDDDSDDGEDTDSDDGDSDVDEDSDDDDGDLDDSDSGKGGGKVKEEKPAKPADDGDSDDGESDEDDGDSDDRDSDDDEGDSEDAVIEDRKGKPEVSDSEDKDKDKERKDPEDFESDLAL